MFGDHDDKDVDTRGMLEPLRSSRGSLLQT